MAKNVFFLLPFPLQVGSCSSSCSHYSGTVKWKGHIQNSDGYYERKRKREGVGRKDGEKEGGRKRGRDANHVIS